MMTPRRKHLLGPVTLAVLGVVVMLVGLTLHWWRPERYELEAFPILIGAAIAFVGFYGMDPRGAKDGGAFLVDAGTKIVSVVRDGRRATDNVLVTQQLPRKIEEFEQRHAEIPPLTTIPASEKGA